MDLAFMADVLGQLLRGLPLTLELFLVSIVFGAGFAALVTWVRWSAPAPLAALAEAYVFVFRGTPLLVQLFLIYYGLSQFPAVRASIFWPFLRDPFWCSVLALGLNTGAYSSEIFRGALLAVPRGQTEAARACGMSGFCRFRRIVFPIALRQGLPAYSTEVILMTKATALASIVTLRETMFVAQKINSQTYRAIEVFLCAGLIYLVLNTAISRGIAALEWWLSPHLRRMRALPGVDAKVELGAVR